jgi:transcriptional regulator with GAF, ATPase, and Fis domain
VKAKLFRRVSSLYWVLKKRAHTPFQLGMAADRIACAGADIGSSSCSTSSSRGIELLARRSCRDVPRTLAGWQARCHSSAELAEEDLAYAEALGRTLAPLLQALSEGRRDVAELHALELFQELRLLGLLMAATLQVIDCLHATLCELLDSAEHGAANDELRRLLTRVAVDVATAKAAPAVLNESNTRRRVASDSEIEHELIGSSVEIRRLRAELRDIAVAPGAVLIVGESGTGKELVAQALHRLAEPGGSLLAINCSALPRELIESELFGHERGAFTGSRDSAQGLLRAAGQGTVFLDELTEMPEALQPKLLRALEQRAV